MDLLLTTPALLDSASASASGASPGGNPNSPSSISPAKVRAACNRCHAQKLRCMKKDGQEKCERCHKLRTSCRFSPRAPRSSLKQTEPAIGNLQEPFALCQGDIPNVSAYTVPGEYMPNVNAKTVSGEYDSEWIFPSNIATDLPRTLDANIYMDLCYPTHSDSSGLVNCYWSSPSLHSQMNLLETYAPLNQDLVPINNNMSSASPPGLTPPGSLSTFKSTSSSSNYIPSPVRSLANLNVALHECAEKLPTMPQVGVYPQNLPYLSPGEKQSAQKVASFAIDELFRLTSEFVDTLQRLSRHESDTDDTISPNTHAPRPQTVHSLLMYSPSGQGVLKTCTSLLPTPFSRVDEATMLLIMSCHCRLIDTLVSLFRMMQACVEHSITPQLDKEVVIILPRLEIGSHQVPELQVDAKSMLSPSTSSMYMLMVTMLSTKLCEQITEIIETGRGKEIGANEERQENSFLSSRQAMWEGMKDKTEVLARDIDTTRRLLQRSSTNSE